jgi:hypothetical protein
VLDRGERLALLPLGDAEAAGLLASVSEEERMQTWWLVGRDRVPVRGDRGGGVPALCEMRLTRALGRLLVGLRASGVVDAFDRLVARHRSRLGRILPDGPAPRRYP